MRFGLDTGKSAAEMTALATAAKQKALDMRARHIRTKERFHGGEGYSDSESDEDRAAEKEQQQQEKVYTPRQFKAPETFKSLAVDPRFTRPNVRSVGQRMLMADLNEMQYIPQKTAPAGVTAFLLSGRK